MHTLSPPLSPWKGLKSLFRELEDSQKGALFQIPPLLLPESFQIPPFLLPESFQIPPLLLPENFQKREHSIAIIEIPAHLPYIRSPQNSLKWENKTNEVVQITVEISKTIRDILELNLEGRIQNHEIEKKSIRIRIDEPFLVGKRLEGEHEWWWGGHLDEFSFLPLTSPLQTRFYLLFVPHEIRYNSPSFPCW